MPNPLLVIALSAGLAACAAKDVETYIDNATILDLNQECAAFGKELILANDRIEALPMAERNLDDFDRLDENREDAKIACAASNDFGFHALQVKAYTDAVMSISGRKETIEGLF